MAKRSESVGRLANAEAAVLGHEYIGTEHLLLALSGQAGTVANWSLTAHGVQREQLRVAVGRIVQTAPSEVQAERPWTPRAKRAVEFAIDEAQALGHDYVGPEHLLLGLLRVENGVGIQALRELGADAGSIRQAVIDGLEQVE